MIAEVAELQVNTIFRNCHRCGLEFRADQSARICSACRKPRDAEEKPFSRRLSLREKQIVDLVCQGRPNKEIAFRLHLREGTIKEYLHRIFRKVEVANRTELAVWSLTARETAA